MDMSTISFAKNEKELLINKIQRYFQDELDQELGQFDAEFLLDFFSKEVGTYYYNQGLNDAKTVLAGKLDTLMEAIDEIEKPTEFVK